MNVFKINFDRVKRIIFTDVRFSLLSIFILSLGGILRFWHLNRQSLWQDEIHTAIYVNDHPSLWEVIHRVATWDLHSPLFYVLLRVQVWFQQLVSIPLTDGNLRIISALLGFLALPVLYFLFRRVFNHKFYALSAVFLAVINIYGIYYSQELRMYSLILLLSPSLLYFGLNLWDNDNKLNLGAAMGYVTCSVMLIYSSLVTLFFVFGVWLSVLVISVFQRKNHPQQITEVIKLGFMIFICYLPWLGVMWKQSMTLKEGVGTGLVITHPRELFKFAFEKLLFHDWKLDINYGIINKIVRNLIPFSLLNLLDRKNRQKHLLIISSFCFAFILYYVIIFNRDFQCSRYFAPWWPYAIYFIVAGFSGIIYCLNKINPRLKLAGIIFMALFMGYYTFVQSKQIHYYFSQYEKENWRGLVEYLNIHKKAGDVLVTGGDWHKTNLTYYGVTLPFVYTHDLKNDKYTANFKRYIYIEVKNPQYDTKLRLPQNFKKVPWPIHCKNYYIWEPESKSH